MDILCIWIVFLLEQADDMIVKIVELQHTNLLHPVVLHSKGEYHLRGGFRSVAPGIRVKMYLSHSIGNAM